MNAQKPKYSIVIPAYKEEGFIENTLESLRYYLHQQSIHAQVEVIVVSADGQDKTQELAIKHALDFAYFELITPGPKIGKGRDVRLGMLAAKGDFILFMDADLATPLSYVAQAFEVLEQKKADIVIGERVLRTIHKGTRLVGSMGSNLLIQAVLLPGFKDTQCGFKAFTKNAVERIFEDLHTEGWGFDLEVLARAKSQKLSIAKLSIDNWTDPKEDIGGLVGESHAKAFAKTLSELVRIKKSKLRGEYNR